MIKMNIEIDWSIFEPGMYYDPNIHVRLYDYTWALLQSSNPWTIIPPYNEDRNAVNDRYKDFESVFREICASITRRGRLIAYVLHMVLTHYIKDACDKYVFGYNMLHRTFMSRIEVVDFRRKLHESLWEQLQPIIILCKRGVQLKSNNMVDLLHELENYI